MNKIIANMISRYWQWRIRKAGAVVDKLDGMMSKAGYRRTQKRQFWRDFVSKSKVREASAAKMLMQGKE